jgi:hypothetical protein
VREPDVVSRLLKLALLAWVGRWAAQELAAYAGRHWQRPGPAPKDFPRPPGWMPYPDE